MNITSENAKRLKEIVDEMIDLLSEYKNIAQKAMTASEYNQFRYTCLSHVEPGLIEDSNWVGHYTSLEKVAEQAIEDAKGESEEEEEE